MKIKLLFFCAFLFSVSLQAQSLQRVIKGLVTDQAGQVLANKKVEARFYSCTDETNQQIVVESTSDEEGYYELWLDVCDDETIVVIAYCGEGFQSVDLYSFSEGSKEINFTFDCNFDYDCDASFSFSYGEPDDEKGGIPFYFEAVNPNNKDYFYEWAFLGAVDFEGDASETPLVYFPSFGQYTICMQSYIDGDPYNVNCEFCETIDAGLAARSFVSTSTKSPVFAEAIKLFPNPTSSEVQLELDLLKEEMLTIEVNNLLGQTLEQKQARFLKGNNRLHLDLDSYPKGIYLVTVHSADGYFSQKVVKE